MVLEESPPTRDHRRPRSRSRSPIRSRSRSHSRSRSPLPRRRTPSSPRKPTPSYSPRPSRRRARSPRSRTPPRRARDSSSFDSRTSSSYSSLSRSPPRRRRRLRRASPRARSPESSASYSSFSSRSPSPRQRRSRDRDRRRRSVSPLPPPARRYRPRYSPPPRRLRPVTPPPRRRRYNARYERREERGVEARRERPLRRDDRGRDLRTVFVSQLAQRVRQSDLHEFFSRAGRVRDVRLVMDRVSARHKGAGYVEFHEEDSVARAVALDEAPLRGFPIAVKAIVELTGAPQVRPLDRPGKETPRQMGRDDVASGNPLKAHDDSVVGWSNKYRARKPESEVASIAAPVPHAPPAPQVPRLVSIEELKRLLNPLGLPAPPPVPTVVGSVVGTTGQLIEQVPLPTAGNAKGPVTPSGPPGAFTRLYVGSISFQLTESDLRAIFEPFGAISSLQLQRDGSGNSRGYGFVEFLTHESAKKALEINGLAVAGRTLKVALASQEHRMVAPTTLQEASTLESVPLPGPKGITVDVPGELDEGGDGGLAINASQRVALMQQLSRGESIGKSGGDAGKLPVSTEPSRSLMLTNLFDPATEQKGFELDLAEDVRDECISKYGAVAHLYVEAKSQGVVFIRFQMREDAEKARFALNGRWFGGRRIQASFVEDMVYLNKFPKATKE